ncbi:hypothetical protein [[Mycoplasma] testudinis]|uniref:hypothetical protein n=1 Tax=[Mycoplasma] testudinis TaxID=33924 RepID=UPI00048A29AE|nr:hypothetical protein [[Mycoplasma] testudinis]
MTNENIAYTPTALVPTSELEEHHPEHPVDLKFDGSEEPENFKLLDEQYEAFNKTISFVKRVVTTEIVLTTLYSSFFTLFIIFLGVNNWVVNSDFNFAYWALEILFLVLFLVAYISIELVLIFSWKKLSFLKKDHKAEWKTVHTNAVLIFSLGWFPFLNITIASIPAFSFKTVQQDEYDKLNLWYQESIANIFAPSFENFGLVDSDFDTDIFSFPENDEGVTNPISPTQQIYPDHTRRVNLPAAWNEGPFGNLDTVQTLQIEPSSVLNQLRGIVKDLRFENQQLRNMLMQIMRNPKRPAALPESTILAPTKSRDVIKPKAKKPEIKHTQQIFTEKKVVASPPPVTTTVAAVSPIVKRQQTIIKPVITRKAPPKISFRIVDDRIKKDA